MSNSGRDIYDYVAETKLTNALHSPTVSGKIWSALRNLIRERESETNYFTFDTLSSLFDIVKQESFFSFDDIEDEDTLFACVRIKCKLFTLLKRKSMNEFNKWQQVQKEIAATLMSVFGAQWSFVYGSEIILMISQAAVSKEEVCVWQTRVFALVVHHLLQYLTNEQVKRYRSYLRQIKCVVSIWEDEYAAFQMILLKSHECYITGLTEICYLLQVGTNGNSKEKVDRIRKSSYTESIESEQQLNQIIDGTLLCQPIPGTITNIPIGNIIKSIKNYDLFIPGFTPPEQFSSKLNVKYATQCPVVIQCCPKTVNEMDVKLMDDLHQLVFMDEAKNVDETKNKCYKIMLAFLIFIVVIFSLLGYY